jgi:hypothetical protein
MEGSILKALGASVGLFALMVTAAGAQDECGGAAEGVDLTVQRASLRERADGLVVLYTVTNRGHLASTSYRVSLVVDGTDANVEDEYQVGLEPGRHRRWELAVPAGAASPGAHDLAVRVSTASAGSAAGPSYTDQCTVNDTLPASQSSPTVPSRRSVTGVSLIDAD